MLADFVAEFQQESPNLFSKLLSKNVPVPKSDDASLLFREQGNKLYQQKQFKVGYLIFVPIL